MPLFVPEAAAYTTYVLNGIDTIAGLKITTDAVDYLNGIALLTAYTTIDAEALVLTIIAANERKSKSGGANPA